MFSVLKDVQDSIRERQAIYFHFSFSAFQHFLFPHAAALGRFGGKIRAKTFGRDDAGLHWGARWTRKG